MIWIFLIKHRERRGQLYERCCPDFSIAPSIPFCLARMKKVERLSHCLLQKILIYSFLCWFGCDVFTIIKRKIIQIFSLHYNCTRSCGGFAQFVIRLLAVLCFLLS